MINDIVQYRRQGMSFRKIAEKLNSTVGKVHYQWIKNGMTDSQLQQKALGSEEVESIRDSFLETKFIKGERLFSSWKLAPWQTHLVASYFKEGINLDILILRLYDVTDIYFNGENAHSVFEFQLPKRSTHWTIKGVKPGRSYLTEIGFRIKGLTFFPVLRSNATYSQLGSSFSTYSASRENQPVWSEKVSSYSYYENKDRENNGHD
jgi:uncharacterized protein